MRDVPVPPHSIEAEQAVLGGLLLDNRVWDTVADRITEADFYRTDHRLIFRAIAALAARNDPFDAVTLSGWMEARSEFEDAGGLAYVGLLAKETPTAANVRAYADIVRERSVLRSLIGVGTEIADSAFNPDGRDSRELVEDAQRRVFALADVRSAGGPAHIAHHWGSWLDDLDARIQRGGGLAGLSTGFEGIDDLTCGLSAGDLIVLAARPSMGKTSLAMNIVERVAMGAGDPVLVFSLEMSAAQLLGRMVSGITGIPMQRIRQGRLTRPELERVVAAKATIADAPITVDDGGALTVAQIRSRARRVAMTHGCGLVVVDYLQLIRGDATRRAENRNTEVAAMSASLKALAKELSVPVLVLSQLNRGVEQRADKRPTLADLRDSGAIEQDADIIAFIYRDEVYNRDNAARGIAELNVAKNRNGPVGTRYLAFHGELTRFDDHDGVVPVPATTPAADRWSYGFPAP